VAFVGDDQVEALDRDRRVVMDDALRPVPAGFETRPLLVFFGEFAASQQRIDTLDRGDDDRGVFVKTGRP
jgi:hypothetical protein